MARSDGVDGLHRRRACERLAPGQGLVEHDAKRVEVGAGRGLTALDAFGGQVGGCPDEQTTRCHVGVVGHVEALGDSEVGHLGAAIVGEKDVAGLHVSVDDSCPMGRSQRGEDIAGDSQQPVRRHGAASHAVGQGLAGQALHHDERDAIVVPGVVDGHHIGMGEAGRAPRFDLEPGADIGPRRHLRPQRLDRDPAAQTLIRGFVDRSHSTPAQNVADQVPTGQELPGGQGQRAIGRGAGRGGGVEGHGLSRTPSGARRCRSTRPSERRTGR